MMDYADMPRQNDLDGRGNLSLRALKEFTLWFLKACLDQVTFMSGLFEIEALMGRFKKYVAQSKTLKPEALRLLEEALMRGEYDRGEAARIPAVDETVAEGDTVRVGTLIGRTLRQRGDEAAVAAIRAEVAELCAGFPPYPGLAGA